MLKIIRDLWGQEQWSEEVVKRLEGILDVNMVEGPSIWGILTITFLASHSCIMIKSYKVSVLGW